MTRELNQQGNKILESFPLIVNFHDVFIIDLTLIENPIYTSKYTATFHKGEFQPFHNTESTNSFSITSLLDESAFDPSKYTAAFHASETPLVDAEHLISPAPLPPIDVGNNMLFVWLTDYFPNTAGHLFYRYGWLAYTVRDLPFKLTTWYLKLFVPSLYEHYPDMEVQIGLNATKPPHFKFTPKGGELVLFGNIDVEVILPNGIAVTALTLSLQVDLNVLAKISTGSLAETIIALDVSLSNASLTICSSNIGKLDITLLQEAFSCFINVLVVPAINQYCSQWLTFPAIEGISCIDPHLTFREGYALLSTDIRYM